MIAALALAGAARRLGELRSEPERRPRRIRGAAVTGALLVASAVIGHTAARKLDE